MKQLRRLSCLIGLVCVLAWIGAAPVMAASFETERYDVAIDVKADNTWQTTETIRMNFTDYSHGIFRYIPYAGSIYYYDADNRPISRPYKLTIGDIQIPGYEYQQMRERGNLILQIGSADQYVYGPLTYEIGYRVSNYDDRDAQLDQFYWDILPTDWNTPIKAGGFTVRMPKPVEASAIQVYAGFYGAADTTAVEWKVDGGVITGDLKRELKAGEGLTIRVLLPEGYFTGERSLEWVKYLLLAISLLVPLAAFLLWLAFGRDPKMVQTVEFYPPEGLNPAEAGYLIDGAVSNKDMISLVIDFANRGILSIHDDGEEGFTLKKTGELPETAKKYEKTVFFQLFDGREEVYEKELKGTFYETLMQAKGELLAQYRGRGARIYTQTSQFARFVGTLLMAIPLAAAVFLCTHYALLPFSSAMVTLPALLLAMGTFIALVSIYDRQYSLSPPQKVGGRAVAGILLAFALMLILAYCIYVTGQIVLPGLATAGSIVAMMLNARMKQRSKAGVERLGKLLGFKEFIRTAELDRIKALTDEDAQYFYKVLPYAYVFGLTDRWAEKFESLAVAPPQWHGGQDDPGGRSLFNTMLFMNSFNHTAGNLQQSMSMPPVQSGSGGFGSGFSGGGGFGGGGGGFSGGGFGGGGGGGW